MRRHFIISTDQKSLKFLLGQQLVTPLQQTWLAKLMAFDYEIQYKQGRENMAVDALSRDQGSEIMCMAIQAIRPGLLDIIKDTWQSDPNMQQLINELQVNPDSHPSYTWKNGELRRKGRLVIWRNDNLRQ